MNYFNFLFILSLSISIDLASSDNVMTIQVESLQSENFCETLNSKSCSGWWIFKICKTVSYLHCYAIYKKVQVSKSVCMDGWSNLPKCLTPICSPNCAPGQVCTAPNKCECLTTGGVCTQVACSNSQTCYPGTCIAESCTCPLTFGGNDCQTTREVPVIKNCEIKFIKGTFIAKTVNCAAEQITNPVIVWMNSEGLSNFQFSSDVEFNSNFPFPDAPFVSKPVAYGISEVGFKLNDANSGLSCSMFSTDLPKTFGTCLIEKTIGNLGLTFPHGNQFKITTYAKVGGFKKGSNAANVQFSNFPRKNIEGTPVERIAIVKFDNIPPKHCLSDQTADCPTFPIYLAEDITTNPTIKGEIHRWTDDDSYLDKYHIDVFLLRLGASGQLSKTGPSVYSADKTLSEILFSFNLDVSGVYSVELTVYDQAGNSAKARKVLIFNKDAKLQIDKTKPVTITELTKTSESSNVWWLTDGNLLQQKYFTLNWKGHFVSDSRFTDEWGKPVEPMGSGVIDDLPNYKQSYGRRNISALTNLPNGITGYSVSYYVDKTGGGNALDFRESKSYDPTINSLKMTYESIPDGGTLAVQLSCLDMAGGLLTENLFIRVDSSPPKVLNFSVSLNNPDIYTSRVNFWIEDKESGIKQIDFKLFDGVNANPFKSGTLQPKLRDRPAINSKNKRDAIVGECVLGDTTCYCTPLADCYSSMQTIELDHCWFDRMSVENLKMIVVVTNNAEVKSSEKEAIISGFKELNCRPSNALQPGHIAAIVICVLIIVLILLLIIILLVRIYLLKKPVPHMMNKAYNNMRDLIHRNKAEPVTSSNVLYEAGDRNDDFIDKRKDYEKQEKSYNYDQKPGYLYVDETSNSRSKDISKDDLKIMKELSRGKLMVVSEGSLNRGNKKLTVAVKSLKNGATLKEKEYMKEKSNFLMALKPHDNIVKSLGLVQGPYGTTIVMEFCEMTLVKWLSDIKHITHENLDEMSIFALNISHGVDHLHRNKIVHKRLSAKNVLLTRHMNQYVAKLIGFGPTLDSDKKASVPIKWLAPETLETINDSNPVYNTKTDAWSYGILLWEMYSKGNSQPYPDIHGSEAKDFIIAGKKMEQPDECPPFMYEKVMLTCWDSDADRRPTFQQISEQICSFRQGEGLPSPGYYDTFDDRSGPYDDAK